jgi:hypothetical protein
MTNPSGAACRCLRGLSSLAGFQSLGSTPRHAWPIDFPFPSRIGPTWCSGILQSDSCGQRPRNRCVDVEPSTHIASTPSRRRLSNRGFDRLRDWESIVSLSSKSRNRETFPKNVTVVKGCDAWLINAQAPIENSPGLRSADIQEAHNRLEYGVDTAATSQQLAQLLAARNVPCYLVAVTVVGP